MEIQITDKAASTASVQCLVLPVYANRSLPPETDEVDTASGGAIRAFLKLKDLSGEPGSRAVLYGLEGVKAARVVLVGCGAKGGIDRLAYRKLLDTASAQAAELNAKSVGAFLASVTVDDATPDELVTLAAKSFGLASYRYTAFKSKQQKRTLVSKVVLGTGGLQAAKARRAAEVGRALAEGITLTRDLANRPANECTPTYLASAARQLAARSDRLTVKVLSEAEMKKLGMGCLLSVSAGSAQPAKLIVLEYKGAAASKRPVALVGKGVTFDTGGISIKPSANMDEMKYDMCGAASVLGAVKAIDEMALKTNVVAIVPAVENMPSGTATKPGDIVTSMSGQTVEILNTDAEGRLILCDALTYTERFKPVAVIDVATLTGACIVALGHHASGIMANDDTLAAKLLAAGDKAGDRAWQLPLWDEYQTHIDSPFADFANIGGRSAGTITAACFLSRFTKEFKWAHIDIAGTAWISGGPTKAATGRPVSLLVQYLMDNAV